MRHRSRCRVVDGCDDAGNPVGGSSRKIRESELSAVAGRLGLSDCLSPQKERERRVRDR